MKKLVMVFSIFVLASSYCPLLPVASAASFSVAVTPPLLRIQANKGVTVDTPITIMNMAETPVTLSIHYRQFVPSQSETSGITYVPTDAQMKRIIGGTSLWEDDSPVPEITLGAKQKKTVQLHMVILPDTIEKDYYFSIILVSDTASPSSLDTNSSYLQVRGALATHVLLSVGRTDQSLGVSANLITPKALESGPVPFTLAITNSGKHLIRPSGALIITNMYGQHVGRLAIQPQTILAGATKRINLPWNERILFGRYTASITLSLPNHSEKVVKTITFWAMPYKALGGVFLTGMILSIVILRVRKRLQA